MPFKINQLEDVPINLNIITLTNGKTTAKIMLNQGASLQVLTLNSVELIKDLEPLKYQDTYASAILFPFANRIENGKYAFDGQNYQTAINETERNNALHGFIHNKEFQVVRQNSEIDKASVVLEYNETNLTKGFPFTYKIQLEYTLQQHSLDLNVIVFNTSDSIFPFTIGWHPYFTSTDLHNSSLIFDSDTKVMFDKGLITLDTQLHTTNSEIIIEDKKLDDCYFLNLNTIEFNTPNYKLMINSDSDNSFLQVYTPPKENVIAIEPTTGISNSFNNKIGLKTLKPNASFSIVWQLEVTSRL